MSETEEIQQYQVPVEEEELTESSPSPKKSKRSRRDDSPRRTGEIRKSARSTERNGNGDKRNGNSDKRNGNSDKQKGKKSTTKKHDETEKHTDKRKSHSDIPLQKSIKKLTKPKQVRKIAKTVTLSKKPIVDFAKQVMQEEDPKTKIMTTADFVKVLVQTNFEFVKTVIKEASKRCHAAKRSTLTSEDVHAAAISIYGDTFDFE